MRRLSLAIFLAAACAPPAAEPIARAPTLAITGVTVVDAAGGSRPATTVLVEGDRIVAVGPAGDVRVPEGATVVDGRGRWLIPGLWDAHVHLSLAGPEVLPLLVAHGVTSVRDAGGRLAELQGMRARVTAGDVVGPRILTNGPVLEGAAWMQAAYQIAPPEHPIWAAAPRVIVDGASAQRVVDSLKGAGVDYVKARNVWGDDFLALAAATERAGLPFASHNPNRVPMDDAARAGLDSFEHAESVWGDFDTLDVAARRAMFERVAATGAMVAATLMADIGLVVSSDSAVLAVVADTAGRVDPRNRALPAVMRRMWRESLEQRAKYGQHPPGTWEKIVRDVRAMHEAGIPLLAGTDFGAIPLVFPGSSVHEELELLVREGGLSPLAALDAATRQPARFFDLDEEMGTIAPGMAADLVLLDADPLADIGGTRRISAVVLRGRHLDRTALDALLAGVERAVASGR